MLCNEPYTITVILTCTTGSFIWFNLILLLYGFQDFKEMSLCLSEILLYCKFLDTGLVFKTSLPRLSRMMLSPLQ